MSRLLPFALLATLLATRAGAADVRLHLVPQAGPQESVNAVAVLPGGRVVATGSGDGRLRLYDRQTGVLIRVIGCDDSRGINAIAVSPDGATVAAVGIEMDKTMKLWDTNTGALVKSLTGHATSDPGNLYAEGHAVTFTPDGRLLATGGRDNVAIVWDVATGTVRHRLACPAAVTAVAFAPDGATLATGGADKQVRLWDVASGKERRTIPGLPGRVNGLAYSPDGQWLACASGDWARGWRERPGTGEVRVWDIASGAVVWTAPQQSWVAGVAFAPDGATLACGVGDMVRLYDARTGRPTGTGTTHPMGVTAVAFAGDGSALVSGGHDRTVAITPRPNGPGGLRLPGYWEHIYAVALSPDGKTIAAGSSDIRAAEGRRPADRAALGPGAVRVWDAASGRLVRRLGDPSEQVAAVAFTPDGRRVAGAGSSKDGTGIVRVWDAATGADVWGQAGGAAVLAIAAAPDGRMLACATGDGTITLRDATTGVAGKTLSGHKGPATAVAFTADSAILATGGADQTVRFWDARTGQPGRVLRPDSFPLSQILQPSEGAITSVALSADGRTVAACSGSLTSNYGDRRVRVWDARTGELRHTLELPQSRGRFVALSPDGTVLASNGTGKAIALWDLRTGQLLRQLTGHPHPPHTAAFSPDGRTLVSGADYREVKVWDVGTGRMRATLKTFAEGPLEDWLATTEDGAYDGSPGVHRLLQWRLGFDAVPADQMRHDKHRPDAVKAALRPNG